MQDAEGLRRDDEECRPLSDRAYVTLTEAVTWIVEGDSRDDDYLIAKDEQLGPQRRREWCSPLGEPDWLLPHLDLLRQGREPTPGDDEPDNTDSIWRGTFTDAKQWLAQRGLPPEEAYNGVAPIIENRNAIKRAYERCYELLRDLCSDGRIELLGIEHHNALPASAGVHATIPTTFFLRPIVHWRGTGNHSKGELSPDSHGASFEGILSKIDARPYYLEVRIKRTDALELRRHYLAANEEGALLPSERGKRGPGAPAAKLKAAKAALRARYPNGIPPSKLSNAAVAAQIQEDLKAKGEPTVSSRTIDKARHDLESPQK